MKRQQQDFRSCVPLFERVSLDVERMFCFQLFHGKTGVVDDVLVRYGQQVVIQVNWLHLREPLTLLHWQLGLFKLIKKGLNYR